MKSTLDEQVIFISSTSPRKFFWDVPWRRLVAGYRHFGKNISPIFNGQAVQGDYLTLEEGKDMLPRNVGNRLPVYSARHPIRAKSSTTPRRKTETLQMTGYFIIVIAEFLITFIVPHNNLFIMSSAKSQNMKKHAKLQKAS
jgi:hypothetical protein